MMQKDEEFMKLALEEARLAFSEDEVPVGAVIVKDGQILARGHNTRERDCGAQFHAEMNCLAEAGRKEKSWQLTGCVIYVTLEPCPMCAAALQQAKLQRIVYGAGDKKGGACGGMFDFFLTPGLSHYPFITSGVLEEECGKLLSEYFQMKRKK